LYQSYSRLITRISFRHGAPDLTFHPKFAKLVPCIGTVYLFNAGFFLPFLAVFFYFGQMAKPKRLQRK
jgi:hypothetical protein